MRDDAQWDDMEKMVRPANINPPSRDFRFVSIAFAVNRIRVCDFVRVLAETCLGLLGCFNLLPSSFGAGHGTLASHFPAAGLDAT